MGDDKRLAAEFGKPDSCNGEVKGIGLKLFKFEAPFMVGERCFYGDRIFQPQKGNSCAGDGFCTGIRNDAVDGAGRLGEDGLVIEGKAKDGQ